MTIKSRSNRCGACVLAGRGMGGPPGTPHCKVFRVCDAIDISMVENYPERRVPDYLAMHQEIDLAMSAVPAMLGPRIGAVTAGAELVSLVRDTHRAMFFRVFGDAGCFRLPGKEVHVGHERHGFLGAPGEMIEPLMMALGDMLPLATAQRGLGRFAYWAAQFSREFFVIHPFHDGNGRTARALVEAAATHVGLAVMWPEFIKRKAATDDKNRYLDALQYAHEHLGLTPACHLVRRDGTHDAYGPLASWWRERLVDPYAMDDEPDPAPEDFSAEAYESYVRDVATNIEEARAALARLEEEANSFDQSAARAAWLQSDALQSLVLPFVPVPGRRRRRRDGA